MGILTTCRFLAGGDKIQTMTKLNVISDPQILRGKPVIEGTRIAVETIMDLLASGMDIKDILLEYPQLSKEKIQKAILFATQQLKDEEIYPLIDKDGKIEFYSVT